MKFAEFHTDQVLHAGPYAVGEAEVLDFAKQWGTLSGFTPTPRRLLVARFTV